MSCNCGADLGFIWKWFSKPYVINFLDFPTPCGLPCGGLRSVCCVILGPFLMVNPLSFSTVSPNFTSVNATLSFVAKVILALAYCLTAKFLPATISTLSVGLINSSPLELTYNAFDCLPIAMVYCFNALEPLTTATILPLYPFLLLIFQVLIGTFCHFLQIFT